MLVDTDVIIWYMRGNPRAAKVLEGRENLTFSAVTYMELIQGLRNKEEFQALRMALKAWSARILPIDEDITSLAMNYMERYFHSHSLRLADALIAATAVKHGVAILTANTKHYKMIKELTVEKFRPE